jgi:hypothetical protein
MTAETTLKNSLRIPKTPQNWLHSASQCGGVPTSKRVNLRVFAKKANQISAKKRKNC